MNATVADLPYNRLIGLEPGPDAEGPLLRLPGGERYHNHLGTVSAGALLSLAEAATGEFLLRRFGSGTGLVPVVRRMEAKFRRPANGSVAGSVAVSPETMARFTDELAAKGRALLETPVELHDETGSLVLSARVEWFVQRAIAGPDGKRPLE
jgi:acyl-coenzyme A thioesterase PaaI-like protein